MRCVKGEQAGGVGEAFQGESLKGSVRLTPGCARSRRGEAECGSRGDRQLGDQLVHLESLAIEIR